MGDAPRYDCVATAWEIVEERRRAVEAQALGKGASPITPRMVIWFGTAWFAPLGLISTID
jgi:hypothetical protein